jgi:hypothetical protein
VDFALAINRNCDCLLRVISEPFVTAKLAHGYFDIDAGGVWLTATASVPQLAAQAKVIIAERFGG